LCSISVILMDNDRSVNHSDKSNTGGWQYKNLSGTAFSGQDPTLFRDAESSAWVRKLLTPDPALDHPERIRSHQLCRQCKFRQAPEFPMAAEIKLAA